MSEQIPEITQNSKFNFFTSIWIVPFIALIIAGWLAYQFFADRGPEIKIIFPSNEGLVAGQSVVKFRNVPVGKITEIYVEKDTEGVVVVVRMNSKQAEAYLTEKARFWIVKPEVSLGGVSGLDTLISGTYINVHSNEGGKEIKDTFIGLHQPYRDTMHGEYFHLLSLDGEDVSVGMPIYYKNIKVGQVEYVYLGLDYKSVDTIVFIDKQYAHLVKDNSKFWIKSMVNVDFSKGNLDVNIAPLKFMLQGGIEFSSSGHKDSDVADKDRIFLIYKSKTKAESKTIGSTAKSFKRFKLYTEQSTANLRVNAPVRFSGFDIGWVGDIQQQYNKISYKMSAEIVIDLDTSVFEDKNDSNTTGEQNLYKAVEHGLRAKLDTLDLISGMLYVDLTFESNETNVSIVEREHYAIFPMTQEGSSNVMGSMTKIMDKLSKLPLDRLINSIDKVINEASEPITNANKVFKDLQKTVKNINKLTSKKSFEVLPDELDKALKEMTKTLKSTRKVLKGYDSKSLLNKQLSQTLEVLTKTSQEMQVFLRMLNRKPDSLIFGDN